MYVIFPADEVVSLSYGRVIYLPSGSVNENNQDHPTRTSFSTGSHVSYPSIPSTSTNSSTKSHRSTKSLPAHSTNNQKKSNPEIKSNSTNSLNSNQFLSVTPPVRPKRKKDFKLSSLFGRSKIKEEIPINVSSIGARKISIDSKASHESNSFAKIKSETHFFNGESPVEKRGVTQSILKTGKSASKTSKSPNLMIKETDVFNFDHPSTSKERSFSVPPKSPTQDKLKVPNDTAKHIKPRRKISSEKTPNKSTIVRNSSERAVLTRSLSEKPNYTKTNSERSKLSSEQSLNDYRELTPPTNSSREKSPPGVAIEERKSKSFNQKSNKSSPKKLFSSKSLKEKPTPPITQLKIPTNSPRQDKSPSSRSLTVDFDYLFQRELSPSKLSVKDLADKVEPSARLGAKVQTSVDSAKEKRGIFGSRKLKDAGKSFNKNGNK